MILDTNNPITDKNTILGMVKEEPLYLKYASEALQADKDVVLAAVTQPTVNSRLAWQYVSPTLKANENFMMQSVKTDGLALHYASDDIKNNFDIVLEAVKENSLAIQCASPELRNNKELCLLAVNDYVNNYNFVSAKLKNDPELIAIAMAQNPFLVEQNTSHRSPDSEPELEM